MKTCILASFFLRAIINIFIQMIFPNIIKYLYRTYKEGKNYLIGVNFNFIDQVNDHQTTNKMLTSIMH